ncbi:MAG TPA: N-acetyl-gamma-glutamyl-phosphate reductase, partial [Thermodesulfovibrionales bacterium]|nr:N-acetyl-gamma-glutamyl-phosphate reductase [Thermodesulfovibrionales bacterium]
FMQAFSFDGNFGHREVLYMLIKKHGTPKLSVGICGASGYTGMELLRMLALHPHVAVTAATSEKSAGKKVGDVFPFLSSYGNLRFEPMDREKLLGKADLFFLALPHGASQEAVHYFFSNGKKVIDLSADYRLADQKTYATWYGLLHNYPAALKKAVYGLPELYRKKIQKASLIANPGCYPTSTVLGIMPAVRNGLIDLSTLIIDSKSGTSGAGRKADLGISFCEVNEGFKAYGLVTHRHTPEIEQEISNLAGRKIVVNFTPHLLPVDRGILTTIYAKLKRKTDTKTVLSLYSRSYAKEPFVRVLPEGVLPNVKNVRGTNSCEIGMKVNSRTGTLIIVSAIDNLVKGASGQAIQNMNLMMGFPETAGLGQLALYP